MLYLSALSLFFLMHIMPYAPNTRQKLVGRFGELPYKVTFRIIVIGIIAMGVIGWSSFPNVYFYEPGLALKRIHLVIMFFAVYLWVAAEMPNNLKRVIRHPMLTGMKLWALGHLLANGDLRSMILFVSFLLFSVVAVVATNRREERKTPAPTPIKNDILVFILSVVIYGLFIQYHGNLFGMPIKPYFSFL